MFKRLILTTSAVLVTSLSILPDRVSSQPNNPCNFIKVESEQPSQILRTVQLPTLGITVDIPSNYRMVQFQDGRIEILNPGEFKLFQCIAKYGPQGLIGGGRYSESFRSLTQTEALLLVKTYRNNGNRVLQHNTSNLEGFIVTSQDGYGVSFVGTLPEGSRRGRMSYFQVSLYCDCPLEVSDLLNLLNRIKPMN